MSEEEEQRYTYFPEFVGYDHIVSFAQHKQRNLNCCCGEFVQITCLSCDFKKKFNLCSFCCYWLLILITIFLFLIFPISFCLAGEAYEKKNVSVEQNNVTDLTNSRLFFDLLGGSGADEVSTYLLLTGVIGATAEQELFTFINSIKKILSYILYYDTGRGICSEILFFLISLGFDVLQFLGIFFPKWDSNIFFIIFWPTKDFLRLLDVSIVILFCTEQFSCLYKKNYTWWLRIMNGLGSDAGGGMREDSLAEKICRFVVEAIDLAFSLIFLLNRLSVISCRNVVYATVSICKFVSIGLNITISFRNYVLINLTDTDYSFVGTYEITDEFIKQVKKEEEKITRSWIRSTLCMSIPFGLLVFATCVMLLLRSVAVIPSTVRYILLVIPYICCIGLYALIILCNLDHRTERQFGSEVPLSLRMERRAETTVMDRRNYADMVEILSANVQNNAQATGTQAQGQASAWSGTGADTQAAEDEWGGNTQTQIQAQMLNPQFPQVPPSQVQTQQYRQHPQQHPQYPQQHPQNPQYSQTQTLQYPQYPEQHLQYPQQYPQYPEQHLQYPQNSQTQAHQYPEIPQHMLVQTHQYPQYPQNSRRSEQAQKRQLTVRSDYGSTTSSFCASRVGDSSLEMGGEETC